MHRIVVGMSVGLLLGLGMGPASAAAPSVQKVTLVMTEFAFTPDPLTLRAGVPVELTLKNAGAVDHELMIYTPMKPGTSMSPTQMHHYAERTSFFKGLQVKVTGSGIDVKWKGTTFVEAEVKPGASAVLQFTPTQRGTFEIGCHLAGHYEAGMKAKLIVK